MPQFKRQLWLLFLAAVCLSAGSGVHDSVFNNFLKDTFHLSPEGRGALEFPRELPGFLVALMTGVLCMLPVTRLGMVGSWLMAMGLTGLALVGAAFPLMIMTMVLGSAGMHLLMPVGSSLAIGLSDASNRGRRMAQVAVVGTLGSITATSLVWWLLDQARPQYSTAFLCAAAMAAIGGLVYAAMHVPHLHQPRARFVLRRQCRLYYLLEFLFGARKQVFITFGPWVLVQVYGEPANAIAGLLMTAALLGLAFQPLVGHAVDRFGERTVLIIDGLALFVVCLGYGYALRLFGEPTRALPVACACFVLDNLLFATGSARAVYVSRMTDSPQELTSTLAMGISINHIVSMTIPFFAGLLWTHVGYEIVFLSAAILALGNAVVASRLPRRSAGSESVGAPAVEAEAPLTESS